MPFCLHLHSDQLTRQPCRHLVWGLWCQVNKSVLGQQLFGFLCIHRDLTGACLAVVHTSTDVHIQARFLPQVTSEMALASLIRGGEQWPLMLGTSSRSHALSQITPGQKKMAYKSRGQGVREMVQSVRALAALAEDWGLFPAPAWWLTSVCNSSPRGSQVPSASKGEHQAWTWCVFIHEGKTHINSYLKFLSRQQDQLPGKRHLGQA